jgi:hypothetical protein
VLVAIFAVVIVIVIIIVVVVVVYYCCSGILAPFTISIAVCFHSISSCSWWGAVCVLHHCHYAINGVIVIASKLVRKKNKK